MSQAPVVVEGSLVAAERVESATWLRRPRIKFLQRPLFAAFFWHASGNCIGITAVIFTPQCCQTKLPK